MDALPGCSDRLAGAPTRGSRDPGRRGGPSRSEQGAGARRRSKTTEQDDGARRRSARAPWRPSRRGRRLRSKATCLPTVVTDASVRTGYRAPSSRGGVDEPCRRAVSSRFVGTRQPPPAPPYEERASGASSAAGRRSRRGESVRTSGRRFTTRTDPPSGPVRHVAHRHARARDPSCALARPSALASSTGQPLRGRGT
jgi:hypothetical protein